MALSSRPNTGRRSSARSGALGPDTSTQNLEEGHINPGPNEVLGGRYAIFARLGHGTFGRVYACYDKSRDDTEVAVKVIRAIDRYTAAGKAEEAVLNKIKQAAKKAQHAGYSSNLMNSYYAKLCWNNCNLAYLERSFQHNNHVCLVFPKYGISLLDLLKANNFRGFNIDWTRELSRSFMVGVGFLHDLGYIHTDIKLENILSREKPRATRVRDRIFVHPSGAELVLIDLGSSVRLSDHRRPSLVCTRQYRPPEAYLGLPFDQTLDIWSCGCVIFEILTGRTLFRTHNSVVHLCMMERLLGPMPDAVIEQMDIYNSKYQEFFCRAKKSWSLPTDLDPQERRHYEELLPLEREIDKYGYGYHTSLIHLLRVMLSWDARKRFSVPECMAHPFFEEEPRESKQTQTSGRNAVDDQNIGTLVRDLLSAVDRSHPRYNDLKNAVDIVFGIN
ncbi:Protein kinase [Giardia duodenalis]|uniref:Protein kinase n=1 Tax=Giardia intestinalis TaxID=5741 RepID=V6U371_GIAIN|nr:Protein kinase [Giardia intestinalis]